MPTYLVSFVGDRQEVFLRQLAYLVITNLFTPLEMGLRGESYCRILGLSTLSPQESPPCVSFVISSIG